MMQVIKNMLNNLLLKEGCPDRLALSVSLGAYIAFCPFIGFHTALVFIFAWLLSLNALVLLAISNGINNPFTMVPIYASGHITGDWLLGRFFGYDIYTLDPSWMHWINAKIVGAIGLPKLSLTAFLLGGNILACAIAMLLYPVARILLRSIRGRILAATDRYRSARGEV